MEEIKVREWISKYKAGQYKSSKRSIQIAAGWGDWLCDESQLSKRLEVMADVIKQITSEYLLDNFFIWFKNGKIYDGEDCTTYDDARFEPLNQKERDRLYFVISFNDLNSPYRRYSFHTKRNNCDAEFNTNTTSELLDYLLNYAKEIEQSVQEN